MDWSVRAAVWVIAVGVIAAMLFLLRDGLTQFALALILWLAIDGLAENIDKHIPLIPRWLALPIALVLVLTFAALFGWVVAANVGAMTGEIGVYQMRLNEILAEAYTALGLPGVAPTVATLLTHVDPTRVATNIVSSFRDIMSDAAFILIFLAFLFPASSMMSRKFDFIFGRGEQRKAAREVFHRIRYTMEQYLWVQTVVSLIITGLTYVSLLMLGLENALFWSFLIFFLNYVPTIGSIVAVVLTTLVALVQFPSLLQVAGVFASVSVWQFLIGNFVQPRLTSDSLNLSAVVMLLALSVWGAIWGLTGAFLAAPLTVMLMIVLAQFKSTRWIAILLSSDGRPTPDSQRLSKADVGSN